MKKMVFIAAIGILAFTSCSKSTDLYNPQPTPTNPTSQGDEIKDNVQKVFGVTFDPNQDWSSTTKKEVTINANSSIKKVQVLVYLDAVDEEGEPITNLNVLNETELNGKTSVKLTYDEPNDNKGVFVSFVSDDDIQMRKVTGSTVSLETKASTRGTIGTTETYSIPSGTPVIGNAIKSWANSEDKWLPGEMLYELSDYSTQKMDVTPFTEDEKESLRALILSYFVNSKKVNNKILIDESGFFNENGYPITTEAGANIIVSPIYKCDGCLKTTDGFGYEVYNSDLYYYYFKQSDLDSATDKVKFLEDLPKYKAIPFSEVYPKTDDDVIEKRGAYALIYWGDGTPEVGVTTGSYKFPEGLKIGFMLRSKANGKHGELYLDGRLNTNINKKSPFASSTAAKNKDYEGNGEDMPRAAWLTVNGRQLLCWESGTDADFNDLILEVQGGVSELTYTPKLSVGQIYTFCFEDTDLGDYDLNDVVIKAKRINDTQVQYELYACGAYDELYVKNVDSAWENTEIHALFGKEPKTYINTESSEKKVTTKTITKTVSNTFTFLDKNCQPYIYDKTTGKTIKLSEKGQDPHGIMIPSNFKYPLEKVCIKDAYKEFNNWGQNSVSYTDWYTKPVSGKVYNK